MTNKMITTPEEDALFEFDAENGVEPFSDTAQRLASKYAVPLDHPMVDELIHALEDAYNLGERRWPFVDAAAASRKTETVQ